jgi:hypothetical protein
MRNDIKTKRTRHDWETHAVFFNDKKIGHIIKEGSRDGYQYTPSRSLGASYIAISGNSSAFTFDEALEHLCDKHREFLSAFSGVYA